MHFPDDTYGCLEKDRLNFLFRVNICLFSNPDDLDKQ
jgi:hypothetical protein